ncbi:MAG: hypothetical protein FWF31_00315 [Desulfobulbus sp.]|nr:hypothetical protein [Desulfobulbus sp.]
MEKKFQELLCQIDNQWTRKGRLRVMFQEEASFGRISETRRCWRPRPIRPLSLVMVAQDAYAAVSVGDGALMS